MTTPTREQVNKLLEMIQRHFPSLPLDERYTNWKQWSEFAQAAFSFGVSEARADLEATIAKKDADIANQQNLIIRLKEEIAQRKATDTHCVAQQAHIERLKEAIAILRCKTDPKYGVPVADKALAIPNSTEALRQHDAELVERIAQTVQPEDSYQDEWFKAKADCYKRVMSIADQIRKGKWK